MSFVYVHLTEILLWLEVPGVVPGSYVVVLEEGISAWRSFHPQPRDLLWKYGHRLPSLPILKLVQILFKGLHMGYTDNIAPDPEKQFLLGCVQFYAKCHRTGKAKGPHMSPLAMFAHILIFIDLS